jgi:sialic acid synthase SpsE
MMFEKHFTLDRSLPGPDHAFSADPAAMSAYIGAIREAEIMLGDGRKVPADCEVGARLNGRRYLTAMTNIGAGTVIEPAMIRPRRVEVGRVTRPELLLTPEYEEQVIGARSRRTIADGESLTLDALDFGP